MFGVKSLYTGLQGALNRQKFNFVGNFNLAKHNNKKSLFEMGEEASFALGHFFNKNENIIFNLLA
jgi:hypothetical protein